MLFPSASHISGLAPSFLLSLKQWNPLATRYQQKILWTFFLWGLLWRRRSDLTVDCVGTGPRAQKAPDLWAPARLAASRWGPGHRVCRGRVSGGRVHRGYHLKSSLRLAFAHVWLKRASPAGCSEGCRLHAPVALHAAVITWASWVCRKVQIAVL